MARVLKTEEEFDDVDGLLQGASRRFTCEGKSLGAPLGSFLADFFG